jgi:hypothetical protein
MTAVRTSTRLPWLLASALALAPPSARAGVEPIGPPSPPEGWTNLCTGETVEVKASAPSHRYAGTGSCWVNTAPNKADGSQQNWVRAAVTFDGSYDAKSSTFADRLNFSIPTASGPSAVPVTTSGSCGDDPWSTASPCTSPPPSHLRDSFGWRTELPNGPVSRNLYGAALIAALLQKATASPPLAPVDLDAVRWPAFDGSGTVGRVFWRAPDTSGNRWIASYDIEYSMGTPDAAFSLAGHVVGAGAKTTLSLIELSRFFYTTFKLQPSDYSFRVCSVNDAGRQCSAPVKAREPSRTELTAIARTHAQVKIATPQTAPGH